MICTKHLTVALLNDPKGRFCNACIDEAKRLATAKLISNHQEEFGKIFAEELSAIAASRWKKLLKRQPRKGAGDKQKEKQATTNE